MTPTPAPAAPSAATGSIWRQPEFREGARDMSGIALGIAAWGLVTGVAMVNSGIGLPLAVLMSLLVFAGTAQLATLPLIASGAPLWVIWLTALCINLRFVIFSATWGRYFRGYPLGQRLRLAYFTADLNFVLFMRRFPDPVPAPQQLPYFWGGCLVNWGSWNVSSLVGIFGAHLVPPHWGLGYAGTLALLGLTCSLLVDRATWIAAGVAGCAAVAAYAAPLKLNIVIAIAAAVAVGLLVDHTSPRRAASAPDAS
ncbi:MAG: AzlC family ABC transporter permease [Rubrivivax sp.]